MYIAKQKRADNIAEYILYLWQLEDLLRALQFSPEAVFSQLVEPQKALSDIEKEQLLIWYMDITELLTKEGKSEHGHLEHTLHLISDLNHLHLQLMELPVGEQYRKLWYNVKDELPALREVLKNDGVSDIELCFRALYAVMLYHIKGDEDSAAKISDVIMLISPLVAKLAAIYREVERGEIDLFKSVS